MNTFFITLLLQKAKNENYDYALKILRDAKELESESLLDFIQCFQLKGINL